jgi:hypothetical protein
MNQSGGYTQNSMLYWYERIKHLDIPMPRTEIALVEDFRTWIGMLDDGMKDSQYEQIKKAANKIGYPVFVRTDLCSGKHDFNRTCYVENPEDLGNHVMALIEDSAMKDLPMCAIVVREYLDLVYSFKAFDGLPIAKERRYFAEDGEVYLSHPYWPHDAIRYPDSDDWCHQLNELNVEYGEVGLLAQYAEDVTRELGGSWSVDFAKCTDGHWYLIDMARAMDSWVNPVYAEGVIW